MAGSNLALWPCELPFDLMDLLPDTHPLLILAPMQAVTDLAFMGVMERYGGPDVYVSSI